MNPTGTYLAIFLGSKNGEKSKAWNALSPAERRAKEQEGIAAWKAWAERHQSAIVSMGGPLGSTKKVSAGGIGDVVNALGAFTVVRADSHEAAPGCSRSTRTSRSSRAIRSKSCRCCRFLLVEENGVTVSPPCQKRDVANQVELISYVPFLAHCRMPSLDLSVLGDMI